MSIEDIKRRLAHIEKTVGPKYGGVMVVMEDGSKIFNQKPTYTARSDKTSQPKYVRHERSLINPPRVWEDERETAK